ncbi:helix-turn-helix transcriptional regulator [Micromonospora sp. WMMD736]|uniref:helix-turn-helix transcriptional regulator n=1 Tax=Micromonospora sp. WMMD736 TaxID=3404112 RepID=UPI003B9498B4
MTVVRFMYASIPSLFYRDWPLILATMIKPLLNWGDADVSELPTGTVTLLLADVEGSTRLWEIQPDEMATAINRFNQVVDEAVGAHGGVRPVEQGEGDSFVAAFTRASDAVACALALQCAPLMPIRLRIGLHTGEVQLRDDSNYAGPAINRTARLRDLAHGGQTVISGATEPLVVDSLPEGTWLVDLGSHRLRDLPRPERVVQLCHPDLPTEFPPLRVADEPAAHNLPARFTNFIGRRKEIAELRDLITANRLVTLTGAGGAGKTRLAVEVAAQLADEFPDGVWFVDLAPVTDAAMVSLVVARTFGLPDQPGRSTMDTVLRFIGEKTMLVLIDNCEHLLDVCGQLIVSVLDACRQLTVVATSRESLGVSGELSWRVSSLSVDDEAVELFVDRARHVRPQFRVGGDDAALVAQICARLDGMPLAIELAAARVRSLTVAQIADSLHDRFRLLTGGARSAVRRQQTLRASVDWSHALLSEPERVLFRRLAVFFGGFDLDAAQAVGTASDAERYQLLDQLGLLIDKSLVVAEEGADNRMRYRLLETVRQYALEKLGESGEADPVRTRHRDYYTSTAAGLEARVQADAEPLMRWADVEMDNLRAAFVWSREMRDEQTALGLVSSLQPYWARRGRMMEGLAGFDAVLTDQCPPDVAPKVWVRAVGDASTLAAMLSIPASLDRARAALASAREIDNRSLVMRTLAACGSIAIDDADVAGPYFAEAIDLARAAGDRRRLGQLLGYRAYLAFYAGEPRVGCAAAEEGRDLAETLGDQFLSRHCQMWLGSSLSIQGDLDQAERILGTLAEQAEIAGDPNHKSWACLAQSSVLAFRGRPGAAHDAAELGAAAVDTLGSLLPVQSYLATAALASGDVAAARKAAEAATRHPVSQREVIAKHMLAEATLASGDVAKARRWADDAVAVAPGWWQMNALTVRAFIALAQGEPAQAERDTHAALAVAARTQAFARVPDTLECLARLEADDNQRHAARLFGAAQAIRERTGEVRFPMYQADYDTTVAAVREALGQRDFDACWAEGAALSTEEAIAYAQRGRGERKRPDSGWESLTPTECDVVRLVSDGLANKDIAARLFVSPRTVQTHLTHVYAKLGLTSRVQLVQEAARHT